MVGIGKVSRSMIGTEGAGIETAMSLRSIPWLVADEHRDRVAFDAHSVVFVVALPTDSGQRRRAPPS
jgi:hypothetical protein